MADDRDFDREPRWNTAGYWTDRRPEENQEGDRSRSRNYNREDMRRYGRRSQEQADRLRSLRGQGPGHEDWDSQQNTDPNGVHDDRALDLQRYRGRDWGYDRDYNPRQERGSGNNPGRGRGQGQAQPGQSYHPEEQRRLNRERREEAREYWQGHDPNTDPKADWIDNYYGERRQQQRFPYSGEGRHSTGGRFDVTSAHRPGTDLPQRMDRSWIEEEPDYDTDPGYDYEFGTDFDFMDEMNLDAPAQNRYGRRKTEDWNVPGPYAGMGPSGYRRSDMGIREEVCEALSEYSHINPSNVEVNVENGEVRLSGSVNRKEEKYLAEDLAAAVSGVKDVENRIRVQPGERQGEDARVRGMGQEDTVMAGRIQPGMRVAGLHGKHIGRVKEVSEDGFILDPVDGEDTLIPFREIKRTNGQIVLYRTADEINRHGWKPGRQP